MGRLKRQAARLGVLFAPLVRRHPQRLKDYSDQPPSPQNAIDLFSNQWTSRFPAPFDTVRAGTIPIFEDPRVAWAIDKLGGMQGKRVLELGPLEGGHTYMLDRAGASHILAIESNRRAYLKCLIAKETLGMPAAHFVYGDFMAYLRQTTDTYDVVFASGVLYHMLNPVELIARVAGITNALFLWTMYYDDKLLAANPARKHRVVAPMATEYSGFQHRLHRHDYFTSLWQRGFCGGSHRYAYWMARQDILGALAHFGFSVIETGLEQPNHPNGPALGVIAKKER